MDDLISRQAAIEEMLNMLNLDYLDGYKYLEKLKQLPAAQPQRKTGHWIEIQAPDSDGNALYECSICHRGETHTPVVEVPFCWHCGAQMDGGEQDG